MAKASNERRSEVVVRHLDWSGNSDRPGRMNPAGRQPCITCGRHTLLLNPEGNPQHKVCAERVMFGDDEIEGTQA